MGVPRPLNVSHSPRCLFSAQASERCPSVLKGYATIQPYTHTRLYYTQPRQNSQKVSCLLLFCLTVFIRGQKTLCLFCRARVQHIISPSCHTRQCCLIAPMKVNTQGFKYFLSFISISVLFSLLGKLCIFT